MIDYSEFESRKGTPGLEKSGHTSTFPNDKNIEKMAKMAVSKKHSVSRGELLKGFEYVAKADSELTY